LLSPGEIDSARRVAVINQAMVRTYFPKDHDDPIGQKIEFGSFDTESDYPHNAWFEIVGVVGDFKNRDLKSPPEPEAYIPYTSFGRTSRSLLIKTAVEPNSVLPEVRRALWAVEPGAAVIRAIPLEDLLQENSYATPEFGLVTLGSFAGIGLVLVLIGVFSVMAYTVMLQTHEIGVRMALGAQRSKVMKMMLLKGLRLILTGIACGLLASLGLTRLAASEFWGVSPTDPWTFCAVAVLLLIVALSACLLPARRAMLVNPLAAIRHE
jgi:MacB-like periplasmic core domain/FtsX-like permease family